MDQNFLFSMKLARNGDAASQYLVGLYYQAGTGCEQNNNNAYYWFEKAAKQKHTLAMYSQAMCCMHGTGCQGNFPLAMELLSKCAQDGNKYAMYVLGTSLYKAGKLNEGYTLIKQAMAKGHTKAKFFVAFCMAEGKACPKDINGSFRLWQEASFEELLQNSA